MEGAVKSAKRTIEVLEFFAEHRARATVNDLRFALGIPQSSTSMLLHMLVDMGYLDYDGATRSFLPTIRVALLGSWLIDKSDVGTPSLKILQQLNDETGETVVLGIQRAAHVIYVQVIQSTMPVRFHMRSGTRRPICLTAVGHALLSVQNSTTILSLARRFNAERGETFSHVSGESLLAEIELGRARGFFETRNMATRGAGVIAACLPHMSDQPALALGIGAPIDRMDAKRDEYVSILLSAIGGIAPGDLGAVRVTLQDFPADGEI